MSTSGGTTFQEQFNVGDAVSTIPEFVQKRISLTTGTEKDISGRGCISRGFWVNTTNSVAVTLYDGQTPMRVIPALTPVGPWPLNDTSWRTSLRAVYAGGGTGDITFDVKTF